MKNFVRWSTLLLLFLPIVLGCSAQPDGPTASDVLLQDTTIETTAAALTVKVEAENYSVMRGIQTESCSEGTLDVGWIDAGDWIEIPVDVPSSTVYSLAFRVASQFASGKFDFITGGQVLASLTVPNTGAWQNWTTINASAPLTAGRQTIRLNFTGPLFNINWFSLTAAVSSSSASVFSSSSSSSSAVSSSASSVITGSGLTVQTYQHGTTGGNTQNLRLNLVNKGTSAISLSSVKVRYYLLDGGYNNWNAALDYSVLGSANIVFTYATYSPAQTGANKYLEISFTSGAGNLVPGASAEIQARIYRSDWANFNAGTWYSYNPSTAYVNWDKVNGYIGGTLVWGNEPSGISTSSSSSVITTSSSSRTISSSSSVIVSSSSSSSSLDDIDSKVQNLLNQMTLDEKIGQMMQPNWGAIKNDADVYQYGFGSILNGGGESPANNIPAAWADLYEKYQKLALQSRLHIPLIWGTDAVHGNNNVKGATIFPHNIGLGATRNPALVENIGRITALEMVATGINWAFGPCVAVARDERWGRTYESFSEDPELVALLGSASVKGLQQSSLYDRNSVLACVKHYAGDGGTTGGIDQGNLVCDEATLRNIYLKPYVTAINNGAESIMVSYSSWNGIKMHEHKYLLTDVLKNEFGFKGFLISDWAAIKQLTGSTAVQIEKSINAGLDMIMLPDYYQTFLTTTKDLVNTGKIPMSRIDDAVRRILRVKFKLGLFEHNMAVRELLPQVGSSANRAVARKAVQESLVLLKNSGILPLSKLNNKIIVVGPKANDLGVQCGGWSISWQGSSGNITTGTTILQGIQSTIGTGSVVDYSTDGSTAAGHNTAIVVVGELPYAEGNGDSQTLALSDADKQLITKVQASGVPMVVVLLSGRPLIIQTEITQANAWVAAWLPGTEGAGVADVLFGVVKPTGKLPFTWPRDISQVPINQGDGKVNPLFPYGFGLTY